MMPRVFLMEMADIVGRHCSKIGRLDDAGKRQQDKRLQTAIHGDTNSTAC